VRKAMDTGYQVTPASLATPTVILDG
jgi:hypothetical protein